MTNIIITAERIFTHGEDRVRLYPNGGILYIQKEVGGVWVDYEEHQDPGNLVNEFRYIIVGCDLYLQQLIFGGDWGGTEGVDYNTIIIYS